MLLFNGFLWFSGCSTFSTKLKRFGFGLLFRHKYLNQMKGEGVSVRLCMQMCDFMRFQLVITEQDKSDGVLQEQM